jgi:ubiquinone biosynthesis protein COQ4
MSPTRWPGNVAIRMTDFPDSTMAVATRLGKPIPLPGNRIRPLRAFRALRSLAKSQGRDLPQGVAFLRATEGNAGRRAFDRFRADPLGRDVLQRPRSLRDHLLDRDALAALPDGTMGREYLAFMERENISVPSLLDLATSDPYPPMSAEAWRFIERSHVMHDLWHVVTGYGQDEAGEVCILAIRSAQMRHLGVWVLCLGGMLKVGRDLGSRKMRAAVREAYARGRRAAGLYGVDWEALLAEPLDVVRARLNLAPAMHYPVAGPTRPRNRIRPMDALHALRALARSGGSDYHQAAAFMSATEGRSGQRAFSRFAASASGGRLLRQRPPLRSMLGGDRAMLAALPPGTLGRAYHEFMSAYGSSAEGMAELGQVGRERPMTEDERWFTERMNTLHDVRHVLAGYGQEPLGELCLLAFRFAQSRHTGMAFFAVAWGLKTARAERDKPIVSAVMEGYRRGRAAVWLDDLAWEQLMEEPLAALRARLRLSPPLVYDRIRAEP